jgi:S1-C subfamily serine protease
LNPRRRTPGTLLALWLSAASLHAQGAPDPRPAHERGVVGLEVTYQEWDEDRPWEKKEPKHRSAAACVVGDGHLLTTADVLEHATHIQLVTYGRSRQAEPRVVLEDGTVNLALLTVDDPEALEGLAPVELAEQTPASGTFSTVRWRRQQLESAASRVIRFEVAQGWGGRVAHAFVHLRTDLAGGGWAEPVFDDRRLVGMTVSQSEQVSRAIPVEILRAFLARAAEGGAYAGFPALGVLWQVNRDPAVTAFLGQTGEPRGVIIRQVPWGSSGCGVLEPRDILLELDGHPIDAEGYYPHARLGQLNFDHILVEGHRPGDSVGVKVLRGGRELDLRLVARPYPASLDLVSARRAGPPPYVVAGGLVLRELDVPYLRTWGKDWSKEAPDRLLRRYYFEQEAQTAERRRIVLITSVLPAAYNIGYHALEDALVERVNGRPIGQLRDVLEALQAPQDGFQVLTLSPDSGRRLVVLDAAAFESETSRILDEYRVPRAFRLATEPLPLGGGECAGDF